MNKRPLSVTILILTVLVYTLTNSIRLFETIKNWDLLQIYNARPGPVYMICLAMGWVLVGIALLIGLIKGKPGSILWMNIAAILYTCWYWFDRTMFQYRAGVIIIPLIGTIFMLLFIFLLSKYSQTHLISRLRDSHDR